MKTNYFSRDHMLRNILILMFTQAVFVSGVAQSTNLFISEYLENGTNDQIELFNNTGTSVSLTNYRIAIWNNSARSGSAPSLTVALGGGSVTSISNNSAVTVGGFSATPAPDINGSFAFTYTGNDAIELQYNNGSSWVAVDAIGDVTPPNWPVGTSTDLGGMSMERNVCNPNTTWTPSEWTVTSDPFSAASTSLGSFSCGGGANTYTWSGTSWDTDPNVTAPGTLDNIVIEAGSAAVISEDLSFNDLIIQASATLQIDPNASIEINGAVTNNGTLHLKADETGYAQLLGSVPGTTTFESYLDSMAGSGGDARWFNVAIPVSAALSDMSFTNGAFLQVDNVNPSKTNIYYYNANELNGATNEGTWKAVTSMSDAANNKGYSIYLGAPHFGNNPTTLSVSGTLADGEQKINISDANGGWNFVPNPYPSTLSWNALYSANSGDLNSTYYIQGYDASGAQQWRSFDQFVGTNGGSNDIPPGQAFFVSVKNTTDDTLAYNNSQRNITGNTDLFKRGEYKVLRLKTIALATAKSDETVIGFGEELTGGIDNAFDGEKKMNYIFPNIFTKASSGEDMVFNGISDQFTTHTGKLYFECSEAGEYSIGISLDEIPADWTVELEDLLTDSRVDLRGGSYRFRHEPGNAYDRFLIHIDQKSVGGREAVAETAVYAYVSEGVLNINLESITGNPVVCLYDLNGRLIVRESGMSGSVQKIDISAFPGGVYILKIRSNTTLLHSQKLIR